MVAGFSKKVIQKVRRNPGYPFITTGFGIKPLIARNTKIHHPKDEPIPREHKDKNGCVKNSYWQSKPVDFAYAGIADIAGFVTSGGSATFNTTAVCTTAVSDTDDTVIATSNSSGTTVHLHY